MTRHLDDRFYYVLYSPDVDGYCGGYEVELVEASNAHKLYIEVQCYTAKGISGLEDIDHDVCGWGGVAGDPVASLDINQHNIQEVLAVGEYEWWVVEVFMDDDDEEMKAVNFVDSYKLHLDSRVAREYA